jgi:hypothetical protein
MISDEVQMLINRMKSNPEEFAIDQLRLGEGYELRHLGKWNNLMDSLVNQKHDIETIFTPEEIKALRETIYEILRPIALGSIVKTIVGGANTPEEMYHQVEIEYNHPYTSKTQEIRDLQVELIKKYVEEQNNQ